MEHTVRHNPPESTLLPRAEDQHAVPILCRGSDRSGRPCRKLLFRAVSAHLEITCRSCGYTQQIDFP